MLRSEHAYDVLFTENLYVESTFKHALYICRVIYLQLAWQWKVTQKVYFLVTSWVQ